MSEERWKRVKNAHGAISKWRLCMLPTHSKQRRIFRCNKNHWVVTHLDRSDAGICTNAFCSFKCLFVSFSLARQLSRSITREIISLWAHANPSLEVFKWTSFVAHSSPRHFSIHPTDAMRSCCSSRMHCFRLKARTSSSNIMTRSRPRNVASSKFIWSSSCKRCSCKSVTASLPPWWLHQDIRIPVVHVSTWTSPPLFSHFTDYCNTRSLSLTVQPRIAEMPGGEWAETRRVSLFINAWCSQL